MNQNELTLIGNIYLPASRKDCESHYSLKGVEKNQAKLKSVNLKVHLALLYYYGISSWYKMDCNLELREDSEWLCWPAAIHFHFIAPFALFINSLWKKYRLYEINISACSCSRCDILIVLSEKWDKFEDLSPPVLMSHCLSSERSPSLSPMSICWLSIWFDYAKRVISILTDIYWSWSFDTSHSQGCAGRY